MNPVDALATEARRLCPCGHPECFVRLTAHTLGELLCDAVYPNDPTKPIAEALQGLTCGYNSRVEALKSAENDCETPTHVH